MASLHALVLVVLLAAMAWQGSAWKNYGTPYAKMSYTYYGQTIGLAGLVTSGSTPWSSQRLIKKTPSLLAASDRAVMTVINGNTFGRVDVKRNAEGGMDVVVASSGSQWVSLDPITYQTGGHLALWLINGFQAYELFTYSTPGARSAHSAVFLRGVVSSTAFAQKTIAHLEGSHPKYREIFPALVNNKAGRIDLMTNGELKLMGYSGTSGWISLSNVHYRSALAPFTALRLLYGWKNYGGDYSPAQYNLGYYDGRCFLRGLIKSGTATRLTTVPAECRPLNRRVFVALSSKGPVRIDVLPDGRVFLIGRTYGTTNWPSWISFSGITYYPKPKTVLIA